MTTRIIGGRHRGRRLEVPDSGTRPTADRAREGLFNTLESTVGLDGATVLDLYAGSGAIGLEAVSRGAATVVLVESDRRAAAVLTANVAALGATEATVVTTTVEQFLSEGAVTAFDIVFADPPYAMGEPELRTVLRLLLARPWLGADAVLVLERSSRGPKPAWPDEIDAMKQRRYGEATLWYGRRRVPAGS